MLFVSVDLLFRASRMIEDSWLRRLHTALRTLACSLQREIVVRSTEKETRWTAAVIVVLLVDRVVSHKTGVLCQQNSHIENGGQGRLFRCTAMWRCGTRNSFASSPPSLKILLRANSKAHTTSFLAFFFRSTPISPSCHGICLTLEWRPTS